MGNSGSKKKNKKKKGKDNDDGCIGNRKVRTICLCILIGVFCVFAYGFIFDNRDAAEQLAELTFGGCDTCESLEAGWNCAAAGGFVVLIGCIAAAIFVLIEKLDILYRIAGLALIIGGALYIIGWVVIISAWKDAFSAIYDALDDEGKQKIDAQLTAMFGEALLPSGAAILLGLDCLLKFFDGESGRLASNLGLLLSVSILVSPAYYLQATDDGILPTRDGVEMIATGYAILFWTCLIYIILYICTCCTCDCKDKCLIRVAMAVALVIGGVITAIGYYIYVGGVDDADNDTAIAYYIGYTVLIGGYCVVWALDIALDDVKNR